ncbi:MAG: FUSC family protein [Cyanobacteriota bacterium]
MPMHGLRAALVIGLATALTSAFCEGLGISGSAIAYGAVIAALIVRPDFSSWPLLIYPVLLVVVGVCMGIGVFVGLGLAGVPQVLVFGMVAALMQLLTLLLPARLRMLSGVVAGTGVLPLLSASPSWSDWGEQLLALAFGLVIGTLLQRVFTPADLASQAGAGAEKAGGEKEEADHEPPVDARLRQGLTSPFFWRKLVFASLALAIGQGVGAVTPKYLYFGVVLLLNDSIGATMLRVRDRMVGVSLGILMPLLVFNCLGMSELSTGLVMAGTAALVMALRCEEHLRTALISSGVAFIGYGPLVAWYIPNRWMDYSLGCGLALAVGLFLFPSSALRRFNRRRDDPSTSADDLRALLPAAREEARWLGLPAPELPGVSR